MELVEPDTPWREDARILAQKNSHRVPRDKIREMLDKQRVPINIHLVVDNCRKRMNLPVIDCETPSANKNQNNKTNGQESTCNTTNLPKKWNEDLTFDKNTSLQSYLKSIRSETPDVFVAGPVDILLKPPTSEVAVQTSLSEPSLREVAAYSRSIQSVGIGKKQPPPPPTGKYSLDKGCLTDEIVEDLASRKALAVLKSYFPTKETEDLADILKQCNGDLTW